MTTTAQPTDTAAPGIYLWTDPHGQLLLRTRDGTIDLGTRTRPITSTGPDPGHRSELTSQ